MEKNIFVENSTVVFQGKSFPLLSGEFHYWRTPRDSWGAVLDRFRELQLDIVSFYIPWNYHELAEGVFDFTGRTADGRDLDGFLSLLEEKQLHAIARPGPFIDSEWPGGGVPERAAALHRLDPEYLRISAPYIDAVSAVLKPHLITNGGCIVLCQADNEPYPIFENFGEELGAFGEKNGMFRDFLRGRYGNDVRKLNDAWHSSFHSFDEPCVFFHEEAANTDLVMAERLLEDVKYQTRFSDTYEFIGDYCAELAESVASRMRKDGIDVPFSANGWSSFYQDFRKMENVVDLCGFDIYPLAFMEQKSCIRDESFLVFDILKRAEADTVRGNVWSAEFQSGCFPVQGGYIPPQHFRYTTLALCGGGLKGLNYYMLVNRDNWCNAPVNERGRTNEYFPSVQSAVAALRKFEPWNCTVRHDAALLCRPADRIAAPGNFHRVFDALQKADFSFSYFDPATMKCPGEKILFYAGSGRPLTTEQEQNLLSFVQQGGLLVFFNVGGNIGTKEIAPLEPDGVRPTVLPVTMRFRGSAVVLSNRGHCNSKVNFFYFSDRRRKECSVEEITVKLQDGRLFCCGFRRAVGRGAVLQIGCGADSEVLLTVLAGCGIHPGVRALKSGVLTELLEHRDGTEYLSVVNRNSCPVSIPFAFADGRQNFLEDVESGETTQIPQIGGHDVRIFRIQGRKK